MKLEYLLIKIDCILYPRTKDKIITFLEFFKVENICVKKLKKLGGFRND